MLCFSYHFFVNSFTKRYLMKYTSLFLFHVLYQFSFSTMRLLLSAIDFLQTVWNIYIFYGLSIWSICLRNLLYLVGFILSSITRATCLFETGFSYAQIVSVSSSISKCLLYLCASNISMNNIYYSSKLFKLVTMLGGKYFKHNSLFIFPTRHNILTLLKSPHIDKKARDQFAYDSYKSTMNCIRVPMYIPLLGSKYIQTASNFSFKIALVTHFIY